MFYVLSLAGMVLAFLPRLTLAVVQLSSGMTPEDTQLVQCVAALCHRHLPPHLPVVLLYQHDHPQVDRIALMLHSSLHWATFSTDSTAAASHVLLLRSGHDLPHAMERMSRSPTGLFLVVTLSCSHPGLHAVFSQLRASKFYNTLVLATCGGTMDVYTWFPYHRSSECGSKLHVVLLDQWLYSEGRFNHGKVLTLPLVPKNFHGCPFHVSTFPYGPYVLKKYNDTDYSSTTKKIFEGGLEIQLLNTISGKLNFSVIFLPTPPSNEKWRRKLGNGTWTGILGNVIYGEADVAFSGLMLNADRLSHLAGTYPYIKDLIVLVVPKAMPLPPWKSLIYIFPLCIWLLISSSYILVSLLICFISNAETGDIPENYAFSSLPLCFLNLFSSVLTIPVTAMPFRESARVLVASFLWFSMVINTAYRAFLVTYITHPMFEHQISSMDDVLRSGIALGAHPNIAKFFTDKSMLLKRISECKVSCVDVDSCFERVAQGNDFFATFPKYSSEYIINEKYVDPQGKPMAKILPADVASYLITTYLQKNSILKDTFNEMVFYILDSGLIDKWMLDALHNANNRAHHSSDESPSVLSLSHLQGAFVFFMFGLFISTVSLIVEILFYKKSSKSKNLIKIHHS